MRGDDGFIFVSQPVGTTVRFEPPYIHSSGGYGCLLGAVCVGRPWHA